VDNLRAERDVTTGIPGPEASTTSDPSVPHASDAHLADPSGFRGYSKTLSRAFEFAITTALFVGLGWLVDRWLGTTPAFTIVLSVLGLVGQFARIWYAYEAEMRAHEAALPSAGRHVTISDRDRAPLPSVTAQVLGLFGLGRKGPR
jgi:F0F1-type ATP synthase assembly protein I